MNKHRYSSNKIEYKQYRKNLRNRSTSAEATIWNLLKDKQLDGKKFRRQHGIENYIVDFYCSSDKLIIELDGNPHGEYIQILKDEARDRYFETNGYKVGDLKINLFFRIRIMLLRLSKNALFELKNHLPPSGYSSFEKEEKI
jgi:very-short-patch-repair endonuclease